MLNCRIERRARYVAIGIQTSGTAYHTHFVNTYGNDECQPIEVSTTNVPQDRLARTAGPNTTDAGVGGFAGGNSFCWGMVEPKKRKAYADIPEVCIPYLGQQWLAQIQECILRKILPEVSVFRVEILIDNPV